LGLIELYFFVFFLANIWEEYSPYIIYLVIMDFFEINNVSVFFHFIILPLLSLVYCLLFLVYFYLFLDAALFIYCLSIGYPFATYNNKDFKPCQQLFYEFSANKKGSLFVLK